MLKVFGISDAPVTAARKGVTQSDACLTSMLLAYCKCLCNWWQLIHFNMSIDGLPRRRTEYMRPLRKTDLRDQCFVSARAAMSLSVILREVGETWRPRYGFSRFPGCGWLGIL